MRKSFHPYLRHDERSAIASAASRLLFRARRRTTRTLKLMSVGCAAAKSSSEKRSASSSSDGDDEWNQIPRFASGTLTSLPWSTTRNADTSSRHLLFVRRKICYYYWYFLYYLCHLWTHDTKASLTNPVAYSFPISVVRGCQMTAWLTRHTVLYYSFFVFSCFFHHVHLRPWPLPSYVWQVRESL